MIKRNILLLTALFFVLLTASSQYNVSLTIQGLSNDTLLFGHYFNETVILKDTFFLNQTGKAVIQGKKNLPEGMYTIILPGQKRFDIILGEDQQFEVATDTFDFVKHTRIKGSDENRIFYEYLGFLDAKRKDADGFQKRILNPTAASDSIAAREGMAALNSDVKVFVQKTISENENLFISKFLLAMQEIEVPEAPRDSEGNIIDSTFQVKYYKQHYWDYFDVSDVRLLRTPLYEKKLTSYLFKYMLTTLFNYYAKSKYIGMDAVYAYIGEKYFIPEATWSDKDFIEKLKERVEKINPLVIGKVAPDVRLVSLNDDHFRAASQDTALKSNPYEGTFFNLTDIKGRFTILYFWEADCGHCKTTIPVLYDLFEKLKDKGLQVISVNMLGGIEGKKKWVDFVNEHHLYGWINAWNPYDFSYREAYDVNSSNILYLLDEQKRILAKKISPEQAGEIINNELKK
jgi:thiol-disulfide isomerase/thioredoxin